MTEVWDDVLKMALSRHDVLMRQLGERTDWAYQNLESWEKRLGEINDERGTEIERSNKEINEIMSWKNDPVVYVRNYSETNLAVYHGWFHCGWVNPRRVKEMLLGEAQAAGLRPCSSCGHMAVRHETQDTAA